MKKIKSSYNYGITGNHGLKRRSKNNTNGAFKMNGNNQYDASDLFREIRREKARQMFLAVLPAVKLTLALAALYASGTLIIWRAVTTF